MMADGKSILEHSYVSVATLATVLIVAVSGGVQVGALATDLDNVKTEVEKHEAQPAHIATVQDVATIKALVAANQTAILRLEKQAEKDKTEILEAIKELKD